MGPKKEPKLSRFLPLDDTARLPALLSSLTLLGSDTMQDLEEGMSNTPVQSVEEKASLLVSREGALSCSTCQMRFQSVLEQRSHFKLDLHRYNTKQALKGKPALSEEEWERVVEKLEQNEEEEISGSEEEEEEEEDGGGGVIKLEGEPRLLLQSGDVVLAIQKCLVANDREVSVDQLTASITSLPARTRWAIIMLGGGHFAAAVFKGNEVVVHKTFHSYTVRAKQGGSQGSADNKSSSGIKSAGASLRRYNEQQLVEHIQDILQEWKAELASCDLIFHRASSNNSRALFGGRRPGLSRGDPRLRNIPFPTKRATFKEVKRVQEVLARVEVMSLEEVEERRAKGSPSKRRIHRSKSREVKVRELPGADLLVNEPNREDIGGEVELSMEEVTMDTSHLSEFECNAVKKKGKRSKNNKAQGIQKDLEEVGDEEDDGEAVVLTELLTAVMSGNTKSLATLVDRVREGEWAVKSGKKEPVEQLVNTQFGSSKASCLHLAAKEGHRHMVTLLLSLGADPTVRDKAKKVPFNLSKDREVRNSFRKFMGENPEKYDYKTAQIPAPLDKEEEEEREKKAAEKKKAQREKKKEKEKIQKEEQAKLKSEEAEKQRFLNLTDREKRALAAERRLLGGGGAVQKQLCFLCGLDITGKTPFEYGDNKFCSIKCVKMHRTRNP